MLHACPTWTGSLLGIFCTLAAGCAPASNGIVAPLLDRLPAFRF
jgi:hypothetical protein